MTADKTIRRSEALMPSPLPRFGPSVLVRIGILHPESQTCRSARAKEFFAFLSSRTFHVKCSRKNAYISPSNVSTIIGHSPAPASGSLS
jgi:hypothetical protein